MNLKHCIIGLGALTLASIGVPSYAMVLSYSTDFNLATYDSVIDTNPDNTIFTQVTDSVLVSLDRFDGSLGNLTGVDIWFETNWNLSSMVNSFDTVSGARTASAAGRSISNQSARLIDPFRDIQSNREVVRSTCNDTGSCTDTVTDSGIFNDAFDLSVFTLSDFIGLNALDFRFVRTLTSDLTRCGNNDNCGHFNFNNAWGGTVFVSYTYSVPEPSILALLGLGLLGLGITRLRARSL